MTTERKLVLLWETGRELMVWGTMVTYESHA